MSDSAETLVVGDGPAGLSAALLLAKKGERVHVLGKNASKMNQAHMYNYPGVRQISGEEFIEVSRQQCHYFGAEIHDAHVTSLDKSDGLFVANTKSGDSFTGKYLVIATGHFARELPEELGVEVDDKDRIVIDDHSRTSVDRVYAAGVATRVHKIQATVSVGQGASAALDIIEREQDGRPQDFDTKIE